MTTRTFPELPGCGRAASVRIEVYSARDGLMHGSLDGAAHSCDEHLSAFVDAIRAAGFTPFTMPGRERAAGTRCGSGVDYTDPTGMRTIAAPEPTVAETAAVDPAPGPEDHPAWCAQRPDPEGDHDWHTSGWIEASHPNELTVVEAALSGTLDPQTGRWVLGILLRATDVPEAVETHEYVLALEQAEAFGAALVHLVAMARGGAR